MKKVSVLGIAMILLSTSISSAQRVGIAVLDLVPTSGDTSTAMMISELVRTELEKSNRFDLVDRNKMESLLKAQGQSLKGCTDKYCAAEIGKRLKVDKMVTGSVGSLGAKYILTLGVVDVKTAVIEQSVNQRGILAKEDLDGLVPPLVASLISKMTGGEAPAPPVPTPPPSAPSGLKVSSVPSGAKVVVDGQERGITPLVVSPLEPGEHQVVVAKEGYKTVTGNVTVHKGATDSLTIRLEASKPVPPAAPVAAASGRASPSPALNGSNGLFRVLDANNPGGTSFSVGSYTTFWTKSKTYGTFGNKVNTSDIEVYPVLNFAPVRFVELSAGIPWVVQDKIKITGSFDTTLARSGLLDAEVGLKFSCPFNPVFTGGIRAVALLPTLADTFKEIVYYPNPAPLIKNNLDLGGQLLLSFNMVDQAKLHFNGGASYSMDEVDTNATGGAYGWVPKTGRTAAAYKKGDSPLTVNFGGGFEVNAIPYVTPMVEVTSSYPMLGDKSTDSLRYIQKSGSTTSEKPGPMDYMLLTGGLRLHFTFAGVSNLALSAGVDLPLGSDLIIGSDTSKAQGYDYQIVGGLTYTYASPLGPPRPPTGSLAGSLTDPENNPIAGAEVAFPGTAVASVTTGPDGKFAVTVLPVGPVSVKVFKEGYLPKDGASMILKRQVAELTMKLERKPAPTGILAGSFKDRQRGSPLDGTVKVGDKAVSAGAGQYTLTLPTGSATATASAGGYFDKTANVTISENTTTPQDFALVPTNYSARVVYAKGFSGLGTYAMVKPSAFEAIASILSETSGPITIEAWTSGRGSATKNLRLSQARADAVKAYLMGKGIEAARITAVGKGGDPAEVPRAERVKQNRVEIRLGP